MIAAWRALSRGQAARWLHQSGSSTFLDEIAGDAGGALNGMGAPLQVRWKKKRRKRMRMADRPDLLGEVARKPDDPDDTRARPVRLEDHYMDPASPYQMYLNIKSHLNRLTADGRHNERRRKDLVYYANYRVKRLARLTNDNPRETMDRKGFVTPLTELQDRSNLPRSTMHLRFAFPHTLNYKVYWGPPSVYDQPNKYEGSMVGCKMAVRLDDLPITAQQRSMLLEIVGEKRHDEKTGVVAIEADSFPERNQNAALLGDMVEELLREVTYVPEADEQQGKGPIPRFGRKIRTKRSVQTAESQPDEGPHA
mmetsp:Transcript_11190/g.25042  ORF Transcript_11190/g.25042 Transcript_11190/m.25042 type:complete len:309 (-) Transcript_11190:8-934(-)